MEKVTLRFSAVVVFFSPSPLPPFAIDTKLDHSAINPVRAGAEAAEVSSATSAPCLLWIELSIAMVLIQSLIFSTSARRRSDLRGTVIVLGRRADSSAPVIELLGFLKLKMG